MKVNKIFYSSVAIGISFGMSIIVLMNGIASGYMIEALVGFAILASLAALGATSVFKKLQIVWNDNVPTVFQRNKPAECFNCNQNSCQTCEILEEWRMLLRR